MIAVFGRRDDSELQQLVRNACDRLSIPGNSIKLFQLDKREMRAASYASIIESTDASIIDVDVMDLISYAVEFGAIGSGIKWLNREAWDFREELNAQVILFTRQGSGKEINPVVEYFGKYYSVISGANGISHQTVEALADWLKSTVDATAPKLFLSYRSPAASFAGRIARSMKRRGAFVWFDEWEVLPGDSIPRTIDRGLSWATQLLLLVDVTFESSKWVDMELQSFLYRYLAGPGQVPQYVKSVERPIIPILLEGSNHSCLPLAIQQLHYVNCAGISFSAAMNLVWRAIHPTRSVVPG